MSRGGKYVQKRRLRALYKTGSHRNEGKGFYQVPIAAREQASAVHTEWYKIPDDRPTCCGKIHMVTRYGKNGSFWGCQRYPHCKRTRPMT